MQFSIGTAKLNAMLSAVSKGVGRKVTLPITEYLHITLTDKTLSITATDSTNFITYFDNNIEGEEGSAIVKADTLIKLVSKTTKETMTFTKDESHLLVKGNGKYKVDLLEDGEFPTYKFNEQAEPFEINTFSLKQVFTTNKSAIATDLTMPCLTGYNVGLKVITTDGIKMCINNKGFELSEPMLITQTLADLLTTLTAEKVIIQKDENRILFTTDNIVIFGTELAGIEEYPDIEPILDLEHDAMTVVPKDALLKAIDRLSIFINSFDNSGIRVSFGPSTISLTDLKENSTEEIKMVEHVRSVEFEDETFSVVLNVDFLRDLVSATKKEDVCFYYSEDLNIPIKILDDEATFILSTMEVDEV